MNRKRNGKTRCRFNRRIIFDRANCWRSRRGEGRTAIEGVGYRGKIADNDRNRFCINAKTSSVYFFPLVEDIQIRIYFSFLPVLALSRFYFTRRGGGERESTLRGSFKIRQPRNLCFARDRWFLSAISKRCSGKNFEKISPKYLCDPSISLLLIPSSFSFFETIVQESRLSINFQ